MIASRLPAATAAMPWSEQSEIICVPTRPLVVKPQTKNVPANSQKSGVFAPYASPANAVLSGLDLLGTGMGWFASAPKGTSAASAGHSGNRNATKGMSAARPIATVSTTGFQPPDWASAESAGKKISVPVDVLAA